MSNLSSLALCVFLLPSGVHGAEPEGASREVAVDAAIAGAVAAVGPLLGLGVLSAAGSIVTAPGDVWLLLGPAAVLVPGAALASAYAMASGAGRDLPAPVVVTRTALVAGTTLASGTGGAIAGVLLGNAVTCSGFACDLGYMFVGGMVGVVVGSTAGAVGGLVVGDRLGHGLVSESE